MSIKLVLLKSGEDIISDVSEMVVGEEENRTVIGYLFKKPCIVKMRLPSDNFPIEESVGNLKKSNYEVSLFPWMPLCSDEVIPVPSDWVVTIVEPVEKLKNIYIQDIENNDISSKADSLDEQSNSNISD